MICVALFTVSSFLCGIAPSLGMLLLFRVFQGAGGGGLAPSEQSMLADTFPGKYFGMAFAIYGMAVVVAPAVGPALGGWITDNFSWRWIFFMNVPVGHAFPGAHPAADPGSARRSARRAPGASGSTPWASPSWCWPSAACRWCWTRARRPTGSPPRSSSPSRAGRCVGLIGLVVWETLVEKDPIVDLPLLANGNLATSMALQFVVGFILNSTTVLVPLFAQQLLGYDATQAGLVLMPGGLMLMVMMPIAGQLVRRVQPKYLMAAGLALLTLSLVLMSGFNTQVAFGNLVWARLIQCLGLPLFFIPLNTIAYGNLPQGKSNSASAMMNLMRNLGGSIGIAMASHPAGAAHPGAPGLPGRRRHSSNQPWCTT